MSEPFIQKYGILTAELSNVNREKHKHKSHRVCRRGRKSSRIPIRSLRNKRRKVREYVYARIVSCIPMSSTLFCHVNAKKLLIKTNFWFNCREKIRLSIRKIKYRASRYLTLFSCYKLMCCCKSEVHIANYFTENENQPKHEQLISTHQV